MKILLCIDKIVVLLRVKLSILIVIVCAMISVGYMPRVAKERTISGIIDNYEEEHYRHKNVKGGKSEWWKPVFYVDGKRYTAIPSLEDILLGKENFYRRIFKGKFVKIKVLDKNGIYIYGIRSIELEDGSYSYHDPHPLEYYNVGYFPFCITAPLAVLCLLILLRYFYLLTFASDERRKLVFGDENYNPFK